jgi:excinuclease UvrABC ATPase subunit
MARDSIVIRGAGEHNLKGIDLTIPRDKFGGIDRSVGIGQIIIGV